MLFFAFIVFNIGLQKCTLIVENITNVKSMNEICNFGCDNILLDNITSTANGDNAFVDLSNVDNKATLSFTNCDFSLSHYFIYQPDTKQDIDIIINKTNIGTGFKQQLNVNSITFIDCVIYLNAISTMGNQLTANNIKFINCEFVGKVEGDRSAIFQVGYIYDYYISIEFIDCAFNMNNNWNKKDDGTLHPGKQFLIVSIGRLKTIDIKFTRCYNKVDDELNSLKLIKIAGSESEKGKVNIVGSDNGIDIEWAWITTGGDGLYNEVGEWSVKVANNGYKPNNKPQPSSYEEDSESSNENNKAWMIAGIVFMIAFIISIVVLVVIIILVKKKNNISENEEK